MRRTIFTLITAAFFSAFLADSFAFAADLSPATQPATAPSAELVSFQKIWDAGPHNAFTDLIRWKDRWYCTFRESAAHVGGDGKLRLLTSADGQTWESAALIAEPGIDLRDPKLSITPDGQLMIVAGGSIYEGKTLKGRQPRVMFSSDGKVWTEPKTVLSPGEWLWRVTWHDGVCYGMSYNSSPTVPATRPVDASPPDWTLTLVSSPDGQNFKPITRLAVAGHPNETTLRFLPDGRMLAFARREAGDRAGWIGISAKPYDRWEWKALSRFVGGPNVIQIPDGRWIAVTRLMAAGGAKTVVSLLNIKNGQLDDLLTLPSGGDTSYAGLVWHDGLLWISYYSSHEQKKTSIYLAKVRVR